MQTKYSLDPKFFNEDGSFNVESAMAAGRRAHSQGAHDGFQVAVQFWQGTRHAIRNLHSRLSPRG